MPGPQKILKHILELISRISAANPKIFAHPSVSRHLQVRGLCGLATRRRALDTGFWDFAAQKESAEVILDGRILGKHPRRRQRCPGQLLELLGHGQKRHGKAPCEANDEMLGARRCSRRGSCVNKEAAFGGRGRQAPFTHLQIPKSRPDFEERGCIYRWMDVNGCCPFWFPSSKSMGDLRVRGSIPIPMSIWLLVRRSCSTEPPGKECFCFPGSSCQ
ncbi:hypothetical protein BJX61DRAFT_295491 [Aspergillus egyptiacus]|nr:hypothetical protein BJX61DRAFT_295491 [Aspergillus egyptiacus]